MSNTNFQAIRHRPVSEIAYKGTAPYNSKGVLNASSKKDAFDKIVELAKAFGESRDGNDTSIAFHSEEELAQMKEFANTRIQHTRAAMRDTTGVQKAGVMNAVGTVIEESMKYQGFIDYILMKDILKEGDICKFRQKFRSLYVNVAVPPYDVMTQRATTKWIEPRELLFQAELFIDEHEQMTQNYDILGEKTDELQEAFLVAVDKLALAVCEASARLPQVRNVIEMTTGNAGVSPRALGVLSGKVEDYRITPQLLLMSTGSLRAMKYTMDNGWNVAFEPALRFEITKTGKIGDWYGQQIMSDAPRNKVLKVVPEGRVYCFGPKDYVGSHSERGMKNDDKTTMDQRSPGMGRRFYFYKAITCLNPFSVAYMDGFNALNI